jgi:hypothetical protein
VSPPISCASFAAVTTPTNSPFFLLALSAQNITLLFPPLVSTLQRFPFFLYDRGA